MIEYASRGATCPRRVPTKKPLSKKATRACSRPECLRERGDSVIEYARRGAKKVAGTLRRAVRLSAFTAILGVRHMECAYYFDFCRLC